MRADDILNLLGGYERFPESKCTLFKIHNGLLIVLAKPIHIGICRIKIELTELHNSPKNLRLSFYRRKCGKTTLFCVLNTYTLDDTLYMLNIITDSYFVEGQYDNQQRRASYMLTDIKSNEGDAGDRRYNSGRLHFIYNILKAALLV